MAFALTPEPPIAHWLGQLDDVVARSAGFFVGRPVVLDLAAVMLSRSAIALLVSELEGRGIRIIGIEGADETLLGSGLPPALKGGRSIPLGSAPEPSRAESQSPVGPASLLLETPVRSGQSIIFPGGDVTVLGNVASGAEIVAGGSIHVYGALRGRAMAGANGNQRARIFCAKAEAELLAIDGYYRTAEHLEPELRNRPVQAWLDGQALIMAPLD